jgi:hypothetical protein
MLQVMLQYQHKQRGRVPDSHSTLFASGTAGNALRAEQEMCTTVSKYILSGTPYYSAAPGVHAVHVDAP